MYVDYLINLGRRMSLSTLLSMSFFNHNYDILYVVMFHTSLLEGEDYERISPLLDAFELLNSQ